MAAVAILISMERNMAFSLVLNVAAGVALSSGIFIAVSIVARRVADDLVQLSQATQEGQWRARAQLVSIVNDDTGLYVDWYFRLRLEEEIERARRYDTHFAVLVATPSGIHQESEQTTASAANGHAVQRHLRTADLPALLREGSLAVLLPHTKREAALQRRVAKILAARQSRVGIACFPGDGEDAAGLLSAAARAAAGEAAETPGARFSLPA